MKIEDGAGTGKLARVNANQELRVFSVIETSTESANELGLTFNLNSGEVTGIASGSATLLYFKNNENTTYVLNAIAVGLKGFTSITDSATITIIKNPTTGNLITDATAAAIKSNSNFGSANTLGSDSLFYKGKNAGTVTGFDETHAIIYMGNNSRLFATLPMLIPKGASIAITVTSDASAGTAYAALIGHLKDPNR